MQSDAPLGRAERAQPVHEVRCRTCHRIERWWEEDAAHPTETSPGGREVLVAGGLRRPAVHQNLAAWEILQEWHHGQCNPVVAACGACGQPMLSSRADASPIPWVIETPEGALTVQGHQVRGPQGSMAWADADALIRRHFSPPPVWRDYLGPRALLHSGALSLMALPAMLWVGAAGTVVLFLFNAMK